MKFYRAVILFILVLLAGVGGCKLQDDNLPAVRLELIEEGFTSPVALIDPMDGTQRLFVVDQTGWIWILSDGERLETPFLDLGDRIIDLNSFYEERGLLGLAFHSEFASNGRLYVAYSGPLRDGLSRNVWDHTTYISEFTVSAGDPNQADVNSERVLLAIDKPGYNYEAGHIAFGPDGYLYIATGDSVRDPAAEAGKFAQDRSSLLGKILRIDVSGTTDAGQGYLIPTDNPFMSGEGLPEIFAYGFRNPYRFSFNISQSGETRLFVADVGQGMMEEVSIVESGGNYGWPVREGTTCFNVEAWHRPLESCPTSNLSDPVIAYTHEGNLSAIIGGGIYRGNDLPALEGSYVFGDWGQGQGRLFAAHPSVYPFRRWEIEEVQVELPAGQTELGQLLGIGQDDAGELYLLTKAPGLGATGNSGVIYKIIPASQ